MHPDQVSWISADAPASTDQGQPPPLLVISPHLDDAVLSCGRVLAAHPGSVVVTLFAGGRRDWSEQTDWDRLCGFGPGVDVANARRREDAAALGTLAAVPYWLDVPESTYQPDSPDMATVVGLVSELIDRLDPGMLLIPLGLHHIDHVRSGEVGVGVVRSMAPRGWMAYSDFYHLAHPHLVRPRLDHLAEEGLALSPASLPIGSRKAKRQAIRQYRSQQGGLGARVDRLCAKAPEELWVRSPS